MNCNEAAEMLRKIMGKNIRLQRTRLNMTQGKLAELTGLSASSITNIERGQTWLRDVVLVRICEALHLNPFQLFLGYFPIQEESFRHLKESIFSQIGETYSSIISSIDFNNPGEQRWLDQTEDTPYKIPLHPREEH